MVQPGGSISVRARAVSTSCRAGVVLALLCGPPALAADCNGNGLEDALDLSAGTSSDCNANLVPDECEVEGEGTRWAVSHRLEVGGEASFIAPGDFTGDGTTDLAVAKALSYTLVVLAGRGDGAFERPRTYPWHRF